MRVATKADQALYISQLEMAIAILVKDQPKNLPKLRVGPSPEKKGWFNVYINDVARVTYPDFMSAHRRCVEMRTALH